MCKNGVCENSVCKDIYDFLENATPAIVFRDICDFLLWEVTRLKNERLAPETFLNIILIIFSEPGFCFLGGSKGSLREANLFFLCALSKDP